MNKRQFKKTMKNYRNKAKELLPTIEEKLNFFERKILADVYYDHLENGQDRYLITSGQRTLNLVCDSNNCPYVTEAIHKTWNYLKSEYRATDNEVNYSEKQVIAIDGILYLNIETETGESFDFYEHLYDCIKH